MTSKKILFLFLGLVLPVLVFVFLKMFGKNEFNVPLLYDKGVSEVPQNCDISYSSPYFVPDSVIQAFSLSEKTLWLINFSDSSPRLTDIAAAFDADVQLVDRDQFKLSGDRINFIRQCIFLIKSPHSVVMIDGKNQIRGHYDGSDRDELDRLEAEINIILKKY